MCYCNQIFQLSDIFTLLVAIPTILPFTSYVFFISSNSLHSMNWMISVKTALSQILNANISGNFYLKFSGNICIFGILSRNFVELIDELLEIFSHFLAAAEILVSTERTYFTKKTFFFRRETLQNLQYPSKRPDIILQGGSNEVSLRRDVFNGAPFST